MLSLPLLQLARASLLLCLAIAVAPAIAQTAPATLPASVPAPLDHGGVAAPEPTPQPSDADAPLDFSTEAPVQVPEAPTGPSIPAAESAIAEPPAARPLPSIRSLTFDRPNVVSLSPLGLLLGRIRLNYERVLHGQHGLVLEGFVGIETPIDVQFVRAGGGLGYRWYWSGPETSGFVGAHVAFEQGFGELAAPSDRDLTYKGKRSAVGIVPVVGKRWRMTDHLVITSRIGIGYAAISLDPDRDADPEATQDMKDFARRFPITIEGELSLGVRF